MQYSRRNILRLAGAAPIIAASAAAGRAHAGTSQLPERASSCFPAFDNTFYGNVDIGQLAGFPTCSVVYSRWPNPAGGYYYDWTSYLLANNPPPQADFKKWIKWHADRAPGPVVNDFEVLYLTSPDPTINAKRYQTWKTLMTWTKEVLDLYHPGRHFGIYAFSNKGYNSQTFSLAQEIEAMTTVHFPMMYEWSPNPNWTTDLQAAVSTSHQLVPGRSVYVYTWPQYNYNDSFVPAATWRSHLDDVHQYADGLVIWSPTVTATDTTGWVNATIDFIDDLPTPGVCS